MPACLHNIVRNAATNALFVLQHCKVVIDALAEGGDARRVR